MAAHALYRFLDDSGELLYIGITLNPVARWRTHRRDKPWWTEIATITVKHYPTREAALIAETLAIHNEHPRYNIDQNDEPRPLDLPSVLRLRPHPPNCCQVCGGDDIISDFGRPICSGCGTPWRVTA